MPEQPSAESTQQQLATSQRVLLALQEARAKLAAAERANNEPIAVIGMGCRFPGAENPAALWALLRRGGEAISEVPATRWDADTYYEPVVEYGDTMNTRWGGFLDQVDQFEPAFFGLSNAEAAAMDPQQRLLLEVSWEALEDAAIVPATLAGTQTGIFVGVTSCDYHDLMLNTPPRAGTGVLETIIPNRLSHLFDLQGPSVAVNTACSSSLVAVHLACQSLRSGESDLMLAGGVNVILTPEWMVTFSQAGMMAADGRCKSFDAAADGYVRAEGCGMVVLKRLSDAQRDGDRIWAVVRGSAVNQDGHSAALTAPNGVAQQAVIRRALANAGIAPTEVDYVEAHGSGTPLGDAIEVSALVAALHGGPGSENGAPRIPCGLGSVKANIGHLEAAAGVASMIKTVLTLYHGEVSPHPTLGQLNPHIDDLDFFVIPTLAEPSALVPHVAGISSFGLGGTNAHVVITAAQDATNIAANIATNIAPPNDRPRHLLTLSAKSGTALGTLAARYQQLLVDQPAVALADLCFTANSGRTHFDHRLAIVACDRAMLQRELATFAAATAETESAYTQDSQRPDGNRTMAFLFTGQGAQAIGMGQQLYATQPTFRRTLDQCNEILQPLLGESLLSVMFGQDHELKGQGDKERGSEGDGATASSQQLAAIHQTAFAQPALFVLEYALAQLWRSWGVVPDAVMGHSVGEVVAACVAGCMTLEDGLRLIAERGRLMGALPPVGSMAVVFAEEAVVRDAIAPYADAVALAAINGPKQFVISGETAVVAAVVEQLEEEFYTARPLQVSHAFHSPLMDPMLDAFARYAAQIRFQEPTIPLVSNLTGTLMTGAPDATYWRNHIRQPVRFAAGMQALAEVGITTFVEIGPADTLISMGRRCLPKGAAHWFASLCADTDGEEWGGLLDTLAALYVSGVTIDWAGFDRDYPRHKVSLPTYPFQRRRCWLEADEIRTFTREK